MDNRGPNGSNEVQYVTWAGSTVVEDYKLLLAH